MKVYLAAAWSRKNEIKQIAENLIAIGINVQARWLDEPNGGPAATPEFLQSRAAIDVDDVRACDTLVRFSDDLSQPVVPSCLATGSRMFEMGLAYFLGKNVIVVGGYQCVFDYLPSILHLSNINALYLYFKALHRGAVA